LQHLLGILVHLAQLSAAQEPGDSPSDAPGVRLVKEMLIEKAVALASFRSEQLHAQHPLGAGAARAKYATALARLQRDETTLRDRLRGAHEPHENSHSGRGSRGGSLALLDLSWWLYGGAAISVLFCTMLLRLARRCARRSVTPITPRRSLSLEVAAPLPGRTGAFRGADGGGTFQFQGGGIGKGSNATYRSPLSRTRSLGR